MTLNCHTKNELNKKKIKQSSNLTGQENFAAKTPETIKLIQIT